MSARLNRRPFLSGLKIGVAVLMVAGLFLLGVMLAPPVPAVQAIFIQPLASTPVASEPASVSGGRGFQRNAGFVHRADSRDRLGLHSDGGKVGIPLAT